MKSPEPATDTLNWYFDDHAAKGLPSASERLRWVFAIHFYVCSREELIYWAETRGYTLKAAANRYAETKKFIQEMDA